MRPTRYHRPVRSSRFPASTIDRDDAPWLGGVLLAGLAVVGLYLLHNFYPAYGAGLYTVIADEIRTAGYALPATIPHYTDAGVPFAYPPLAFYALAVLRDLGVGTFAAARFVPPLVVVGSLVPTYLLGRDLLGGRALGAAAGLLVALNPQILEWHISAGGLVRAPAFLFALGGAYAGLRLFRDGETEWLPVGVVAFLLTVLTHPTYALFFVTTYLLFWAGYDRTTAGLGRGAIVGIGGLALAAPWWVTVALTHGPTVFLGAAGTHGGIGGGLLAALDGISPWSLVPLVAGGVLLVAGWRVLPAWLVASELLFEQPRFAYTVGAFAMVGAAATVLGRVRGRVSLDPGRRRTIVAATLIVGTTVGLAGVSYEFDDATGDTTPSFVDENDVEAMEWAGQETPPDATFVVLGDAAEWFPAVADRTILLAPWGMEWRGPDTYDQHLHAYENASACQSASCVERWLQTADAAPKYLYVPRGGYTVRGDRHAAFGTLERSLAETGRYDPVFENEGVVVYRVRDDSNE